MATYRITSDDISMLNQSILDIRIRLDIYHDITGKYLDSIECGVISASFNIDAESDVRRTCTLELIPMSSVNTMISDDDLIWINRNIVIHIGVKDIIRNKYVYYRQGTYLIMDTSSTYDATTNTLSLNCSDWVAKLDGSRNGNLGQLEIKYPAYQTFMCTDWVKMANIYGNKTSKNDVYNWLLQYDEYQNDVTTGSDEIKTAAWNIVTKVHTEQEQIDADLEVIRTVYEKAEVERWHSSINGQEFENISIIQHNKIRDAIDTTLGQLGYIKDRNIDEVGERKGMPYYKKNWDYEEYRRERPIWNDIPFDQEFSSGTTAWNIITTFRDLYEAYECFFDINNTFICKQIPSGQDDPVYFYDNFFQHILISENTSLSFSEVKNVTECWGASLDAEFYTEDVRYTRDIDNTYKVIALGYVEDYFDGDTIAIRIPANGTNKAEANISIKKHGTNKYLDPIPIYDDNYEIPIVEGVLKENETYVFKIKKFHKDGKTTTRAYLQGSWQCHAMCVLTDGTVGDDYQTTSGKTVKRYSEEFFQEVYNCPNVYMDIVKDSPFTIQKLGIILNVYTDETNIQSDAIALESARQENYRVNRLTDNITLTTRLVPFADVNQKVQYRRSDATEPYEYIVKSLSHDISGGTTSWTLMRYYPLYVATETEGEENG